ncbi:MAG: ParB/RepB/Spo0J family partition protein [Clostridiales bacterium]|nr:ParB/RepB/Spo0J family partition protein [Clostridiales bacterium]
MPFARKRGLFESNRVLFLPVENIVPNPNQPRTHFNPEGLNELAASIQEHGVLQPLSVRRLSGGKYELISGERRLRASRLAGLEQVPCILVNADDLESSLLALIENLQRRDLDFVEEATALQTLISTYHLSQEEAARRVGKSQSAVANKLRLLKLSPPLLDRLRREQLTERHGRALLRLPEEQREQMLEHIVNEGLNVAQTDAYIDSLLSDQPELPKPRAKPTIYIRDIRLFLNTLRRGLDTMQRSGLNATCGKEETERDITLTITIPKHKVKTK